MRALHVRFCTPAMALLLLAALALFAGCGSDEGGGGTDPLFNRSPVVQEVAWANLYNAYKNGDVISVSVSATDPDGDELSYEWLFVGESGGTIDTPGSSSTSVAINGVRGGKTLRCTVSDGTVEVTKSVSFVIGTAAGGIVGAGTTWTAAESPYVVTSDVDILPTGSLTIEAGARVYLRRRFQANQFLVTGIEVRGSMNINGGAGAGQVIIGSNERSNAAHRGIELDTGAIANFQHCVIEYGREGIRNTGVGPVTLNDVKIRRSSENGYVGLGGSSVTMTNCEISDGIGNGVFLDSASANLDQCEIASNGVMGVRLNNASATATITRCFFDSNEVANLYFAGSSSAFVACCNLLRSAEDGANVEFGASGGPVLSMTHCYWGLFSVTDPAVIREQTFVGRLDAETWLRDSDLSNAVGQAQSLSDPCPVSP